MFLIKFTYILINYKYSTGLIPINCQLIFPKKLSMFAPIPNVDFC